MTFIIFINLLINDFEHNLAISLSEASTIYKIFGAQYLNFYLRIMLK